MLRFAFFLSIMLLAACQAKDHGMAPNPTHGGAPADESEHGIPTNREGTKPSPASPLAHGDCDSVTNDWHQALRGKQNDALLAQAFAQTDPEESAKFQKEIENLAEKCRKLEN